MNSDAKKSPRGIYPVAKNIVCDCINLKLEMAATPRTTALRARRAVCIEEFQPSVPKGTHFRTGAHNS